jgi:S-adenosylmethionine hydrolase
MGDEKPKPSVVFTKNGHIYIGHDNGCFDFVVENYGHKLTYRIATSTGSSSGRLEKPRKPLIDFGRAAEI